MKLIDRMKTLVVLKDLAPIIDQLIKNVNALTTQIFSGSNPHKVNDATNVVALPSASVLTLDSVLEAGDQVRTAYEAHRASTTFHLAADSTNTVTDTSPIADTYVLLNELKTDYNAHRVLTDASVHGAADSTNVVDAANATTKATAITLGNQLKEMFNAHIILIAASVHGAADETNTIVLDDLESDATWSEIMAMADALRAGYEAHRVLTTDSVHGAADSTNTVSQAAIGTVQTAINGLLNELKTDFNAHIVLMTSHAVKNDDMVISTANASSLTTSAALAKDLIDSYEDHISIAEEQTLYPQIDRIDVE